MRSLPPIYITNLETLNLGARANLMSQRMYGTNLSRHNMYILGNCRPFLRSRIQPFPSHRQSGWKPSETAVVLQASHFFILVQTNWAWSAMYLTSDIKDRTEASFWHLARVHADSFFAPQQPFSNSLNSLENYNSVKRKCIQYTHHAQLLKSIRQ